ncbi:hypothetical protein H4R24_005071 [Coemansia sp. RSA 988]|nr:hypothetical protein H4R24_005071 [Coemansia sp. RSA 988]
MLASQRIGFHHFRHKHALEVARIASTLVPKVLVTPHRQAVEYSQQKGAEASESSKHDTRSSRQIYKLGISEAMEPPIIARGRTPYTQREIEWAVSRLRRKLAWFIYHKRTRAKLDAMWTLYMEIRAAGKWRIDAVELMQFLRAILKVSRESFWSERAQLLVDEEKARAKAPVSADVTMALIRIYAKFGDIQAIGRVVEHTTETLGSEWTAAQEDYIETRAVAYARADLPVTAAKALAKSRDYIASVSDENWTDPPRSTANKSTDATRRTPPYVTALIELLLAWTRRREISKAWTCMSQLLSQGYGKSARAWNGLLHMHAIDVRYRYVLLEEAVSRMHSAGVEADAATYNIMMHGSLLRGLTTQWKQWYQRMGQAGHKPGAVTYMTLFSQLARNGQWSEALNVLRTMRKANIRMTATTTASAMSMERQRNRSDRVMRRFRNCIVKGNSISASEFAVAMATALDSPRQWTSEIALAIRCLEDGRISESAVVDAMAARLPGIDASRIPRRPLLHLLQSDAEHISAAFAAGMHAAAGLFSEASGPDASRGTDGLNDMGGSYGAASKSVPGCQTSTYMAVGERRKSYAHTLNVVIQYMVREGNLQQAEELIQAANEAKIDTDTPHTLISLLHAYMRADTRLEDRAAGATADKQEDRAAAVDRLRGRVTATTFVPPTVLPIAQLVASIGCKDMAAAKEHFELLERSVGDFPSIRAFNAMLQYASAQQDCELLEAKWRQMSERGIVPNVKSHEMRIFCYSQQDDLLRTRRAYTDMLDYANPPTYRAVCAMVRCCTRKGHLELALHAMRHAERLHGTSLNTTTYNYILSRIASLPQYAALAWQLFRAMALTADTRICQRLADITRDVERERLRFADLRLARERSAALGCWLMRPADERPPPAKLRRALVSWITSRANFSAEPTIFDPANASNSVRDAASRKLPIHEPEAPPPNRTTFIIVMRALGQHARWEEVLDAWDLLLKFNATVDRLAPTHPQALNLRIVPSSRVIGWAALALVNLDRALEAEALWNSATDAGFIQDDYQKVGMYAMLQRLPGGS